MGEFREMIREYPVVTLALVLLLSSWIYRSEPWKWVAGFSLSLGHLTWLALIIALISLLVAIISNYDKTAKVGIFYLYDPPVTLTLQPSRGSADSLEEQWEEDKEKFEIPYSDIIDPDDKHRLDFHLSISNRSEKEIYGKLEVYTDLARLQHEEHLWKNPFINFTRENQFFRGVTRKGNVRYEFPELKMREHSGGLYGHSFEIEMNPEGTFRIFNFVAYLDISIDASEFSILGFNLPKNIRRVQFESITREFEILGPDHDATD